MKELSILNLFTNEILKGRFVVGIFGPVDEICENLNDMYRKLGNEYIKKFKNIGLDRRLAIDLANVCLRKKLTPKMLFPYANRLMFEGLDITSAFLMILDYLNRGNCLYDLEQFVSVSPSYSPSNAIQPAPNQSIQMFLGPNGETLSRVMDPTDAGVSFKQAQALNYEQTKDEQKKERDRRHERLSNAEEERHTEAMLKIKSNFAGSQLGRVHIIELMKINE